MEPTDVKTFGLSLDQLAMVFNVELSLPKKHGYWIALCDMPLEAVQYACLEVLKAEMFMPVPAILRNHAREWVRMARHQRPMPTQDALQIREALMGEEEVRKLIASVWPEEQLKEPLPDYDKES
jgi:hypothetical protein